MNCERTISFFTGGEEICYQSTFGRELNFCVHHAYHHCASMKMIAEDGGFGHAVPIGFGVAPSTALFTSASDAS